ncbi:MAG TPA: CBS domain-containing protein [bacterium]|nr:CBS domain-containing protein [bacterium]
MTVASIMTRKVVTAETGNTLSTICEIFENVKFHHIFVVDDQRLVGVISDRNLPAEKERDVATMNKKAYEIMSRVAVTVDAKTSIEKASNLMLENNISYVPVVSSEDVIEGIVSWREIFKFYLKKHQ